MLDAKKRLFAESEWIIPEDLIKFDDKRGRFGEQVHVRIPDYIMAAIDELLQVARPYSLFPKTRSQFTRNAVVWYLRYVQKADPFRENPQLAMVKLQLLQWQMKQAAGAEAALDAQFDANLEDLRKFVNGRIAELDFDKAHTHLQRFFDLVEMHKEVDQSRWRAMASKIRDDHQLQRAIGQLNVNGYEIEAPDPDVA